MSRCFLIAVLLALWASAGTAASYQGTSLPAEFQAFSPASPWNTPIPKSARADAGSAKMITNLRAKSRGLTYALTSWSFPLHVIDISASPLHDVPTTSDALYPSVDPDGNNIAEGVPIPDGVWPDPMQDGHMILVDPVARISWEFSRAQRLSDGSWVASRIDTWDLDSTGVRVPFYGRNWWTSGAVGAGVPLIAGLIRPEEIAAGEIRHALICSTPVNRKSSVNDGSIELCSPASRSDGYGIGPAYIPEGARLQLDPTLDLASLNLSPDTLVVARALQVYGAYSGLNAPDFKLFFQNLGPDGGRWTEHASIFYELHKIPVSKFRVLKMAIVRRP